MIYSATACDIWLDLYERLRQLNGPRTFQPQREFVSCTQGMHSVSAYYAKIKELWEELSEFVPAHVVTIMEVFNLLSHIINLNVCLTF